MVLAGQKEAFEPLVLPYRQSLLSLAYRMTGNWEDAKEVSQEALLRAYRSLRRYDMSRSFRNWILQIVANAARDRSGKKRREAALIEESKNDPPGGTDPEGHYSTKEFRSDLSDCLSVLTPRERDIFILRDIEELNIKETSEVLGCSSISVRVHLSSARRKIRDVIRDRFPHLLERGR